MQIVVTGGSSGVGEALVSRLLGKGREHEIWMLDIQAPVDVAKVQESTLHFLETDMSRQDSIQRALQALPAKIDALANVAGIARADDPEKVLAVNFLGLRFLTEQIRERLMPGSSVVNVSSVAGRDWSARYERLLPLLETADFSSGLAWCRGERERLARDPYTFSKRCVTAYTLRAAQQFLQTGARINCVSPGPIATPLYPQFEELMGKAQSEWMQAQTGRAATAADIAEVIDLLLTSQCRWLNGVDVPVDGGYTAGMESGWIDLQTSPLVQNRS